MFRYLGTAAVLLGLIGLSGAMKLPIEMVVGSGTTLPINSDMSRLLRQNYFLGIMLAGIGVYLLDIAGTLRKSHISLSSHSENQNTAVGSK